MNSAVIITTSSEKDSSPIYKYKLLLKYQFAVQCWKANISVLKMPKEKRSVSTVLNEFVKDFSDFTTDESVLLCKYCEVSVTATKKFQVTQHLQTSKHQKKKNRSLGSKQQVLVQAISKPGSNR
ncbi:hypothetical protein QE152_g12500 [Popillia japonica]|uniref:CGG triplet repeat-binding protein 1 n=1 Tax=Popillia japonica TaxID=7064 RepID=A0AAW1LR65_POPJA